MDHSAALPPGRARLADRQASPVTPTTTPTTPTGTPPVTLSTAQMQSTPLRHALPSTGGLSEPSLWTSLLGAPALDAGALATLGRLATLRHVAAGQPVMCRSTDASSLVALRSGEVALGLRTADGVFRIERIVRGPAWLDLSSAWLAGQHAVDAQAMGPATVIELPCHLLEPHLAAHPGLAQRVIQGLAREVQALAVNTHALMHKDAPGRLAQWLSQHGLPVPGVQGQAVVKLTDRKRDLASQLAITPETLSRLMRSFSGQGLIEVVGYTVRVLDTDALARLGQV